MKSQSDLGYKICNSVKKNLGLGLDVIGYHHEMFDQSGYHDGLPQSRISKVARIMAVANLFDNLTSDRPYRAALRHSETFEYLREKANGLKIERKLVEYFFQLFRGAVI
jgi:HD-GYP domain-containing protein (c-di-GMP phosphodiesterase class II)